MEQFLRAPATSVAREIEHQHHAHIRYLRLQDARVAANIDTPEDFARLLRAETIPANTAF
jgi:GTP:adenosylcobinamide-phosphate guanylyltransferase